MDITEKFFIDCVKAGLCEKKVDSVPHGVEFNRLYHLCASHSMSVIVFYAVNDVKTVLPLKFYNDLGKLAVMHIMRDVQLGVDSETVIGALEQGGVKFMPLKGYRLKTLYPKTEMRYMSDCDILADFSDYAKIRKIVRDLGLSVKRHDEHHDIVYFNTTKSVFELHKMLFIGTLSKYFGIGFEKASLKDGYKNYYELTPEDFYISFVAHSAFHFASNGGVGIRHLTDIYVFRKHYKLDEKYLAQEFEKCGLRAFQLQFEKLERYLFEGGEADEFVLKLADYVLNSEVLGNEAKKNISYLSAHNSKGKALLKAVFPSLSIMEVSYPVLKKAAWLLPIFYVVRWFRILFKNPSKIAKFKKISTVNEQDLAEVSDIRKGLGINEFIL